MKQKIFILLAICLSLGSCSNDDSTTREEDLAKLATLYSDVLDYSQMFAKSCTNPEEWGFTKLIESACPNDGYILYHKSINFKTLQDKIRKYNRQLKYVKKKWNLDGSIASKTSDICTGSVPPKSVKCFENRPQLSYEP